MSDVDSFANELTKI